MRESTFVAHRSPNWERLEALLERADRGGVGALEHDDLRALALTYRAVTADLAAAKSRAYGEELRGYLNRLVARAYVVVHANAARGGFSRVAAFFSETFPREVRRSGAILAATSALFVAAWIVAYWLVSVRPAAAYALLPPSEIPTIAKSLHDSNFAFDRSYAPAMSSLIITNNIRVAMLAFAGGMTFGILTLWEILNNGLMVGGLGALFAHKGFGRDFWATIAPHGVIELTSIQIAGTAGLLLAQGMIAPGRRRRGDALRENARRAGVLMLGTVGLLVVAGTIEGFVTPQRTSETFRFGFGALTAALLFAYLALAGRSRAPRARQRQSRPRDFTSR
jgi:uncharacterized membrane protein SpoIIM required for sporulation